MFDCCERYAMQSDVEPIVRFALNPTMQKSFRAQAGYMLAAGELAVLLIKRLEISGASGRQKSDAFIRAVAGGLAAVLPRHAAKRHGGISGQAGRVCD